MCTAWLERHECVVAEPDATARRGRVVRLTPKARRPNRSTAASWAPPRTLAREVRRRRA